MTPSLPVSICVLARNARSDLHVGATFSAHHDVGGDDAGVVTHRLDEKDLRAHTNNTVQLSSSGPRLHRSP